MQPYFSIGNLALNNIRLASSSDAVLYKGRPRAGNSLSLHEVCDDMRIILCGTEVERTVANPYGLPVNWGVPFTFVHPRFESQSRPGFYALLIIRTKFANITQNFPTSYHWWVREPLLYRDLWQTMGWNCCISSGKQDIKTILTQFVSFLLLTN